MRGRAMAPAPEAPKKGLDFKHPGGKEALLAGGVALGLALLYFWYKNRQAANAAAANQSASGSSGTSSPTALLMSWIHDHQSSTSGGTMVTVPNVVGMGDTAADAAISAVGLKVKDANEPKGGFGKNIGQYTVTSQSPAAGAKVAPGSTVTLTFTKTAAATAKKAGGGDSGEG